MKSIRLIDGSELNKIGGALFDIFPSGRIELITKATIVQIGKGIKLENKKFVLVDKGVGEYGN